MSIKRVVASPASIGSVALLTLVVAIRTGVYYIPCSYTLAALSLATAEARLVAYVALVLEVALKSNALRV